MRKFTKKWFNHENWKLSIALFFIGLLSLYTLYITYSYFNRNEIFWGISDKYITTKFDSIKDNIETTTIYNEFNNDRKSTNILKINDTITKEFTIGYPTKHIIRNTEREAFELGDIGDFIGGYFGFLIGIIGALLTFLAFYIQYKANKDVQKQFRLQQFETQFHKMIDVYLNNKDKFSIVGYKNPTNTVVKVSTEWPLKKKCKFKANNKNITFIEYTTRDHIVFQKLLVELKVVYRLFLEGYKECYGINEKDLKEKDLKEKIFKQAYSLFFNGLNKYAKMGNNENYIKLSIESLKRIREKHRQDGSKTFKNFYKDENYSNKTLWLRLNYEPFRGYLHFLPQYYRNIYSIVNYVVNENADINLTKSEKVKYLRILRSTMSEYEQTMLFYNWYSGFGLEWENNENHFFTEYKMIHNLKRITLIDDSIDIYDKLKITEDLKDKFFEAFDKY